MPKNIDVLFINPSNQKKTYQDLSMEFTAIAPPVWTCLLAGHLKDKGFETAIYDVNIEGWDTADSPSEVYSKYTPTLTVLMVYGHQPSASTQTMPAARAIANDIKAFNKDIKIALGGTHPSALPQRTLQEEQADFVVLGEGLYAIKGLVDHLSGKTSLSGIQGLSYRNNGDYAITSQSEKITDLDNELKNYAWDLLPPLSSYRAHNMHCFQDFEKSKKVDFTDIRSPYIAMNTSLGCPYSCTYCCINATFGKPGIRYWSVDRVMTWIDEAHNKYHVRNIRFDDELFILSPKRVEDICDRLIERNYNLNIWVYGRVDTVTDSILKKLKMAGINWICLGIEAGNEAVRQDVKKNICKDISKVVRSIQDNGIHVLGNYMFGLPEDNMKTMNETLDLAMNLNTEFANFYSVMAYPGSELFSEASKHKGWIPDSWDGFSQHGFLAQPLPTKYLSAAEVLKFRDYAFDKYHNDPEFLAMTERKFGNKVKAHIQKIVSTKIKRHLFGN